ANNFYNSTINEKNETINNLFSLNNIDLKDTNSDTENHSSKYVPLENEIVYQSCLRDKNLSSINCTINPNENPLPNASSNFSFDLIIKRKGTVLNQLICVLLVNDMPEKIEKCKLYADDTKVMSTIADTDYYRCFSKFAWVILLKNKTSESILEALTTIFKSRQPVKFQTDKGREFLNKTVQDYLKKMNFHLFTTNSGLKASVERFNQTLKEKMWRYFTHKNNNDYTKVLDNLVNSYNNTFHRTIKTTPNNVSYKNEEKVFRNIYGVRISKTKGLFEKGYTPNWTR
ncbi:unnamed protein product, partial [Brachionus calyciflorus]